MTLSPFTRRRWLAMAIGALGLAACGDASPSAETTTVTPPPTPSPTPIPSTADILALASTTLADVQTVRFALDVQGETFIDTARTLRLIEARGVLVRPESVKTDFKISVLGSATVTTSLIIIGDQRWSTDLITGAWGPAPAEFGYDPTVLFDNQGGIGPVMERITEPVQLPDETLRDRPCWRIQALVDQDVVGPLTAQTMEGSPITVDLWIDRENANLLRARLAEPSSVTGRDPATWTLDLVDHGADVTIEPPV